MISFHNLFQAVGILRVLEFDEFTEALLGEGKESIDVNIRFALVLQDFHLRRHLGGQFLSQLDLAGLLSEDLLGFGD